MLVPLLSSVLLWQDPKPPAPAAPAPAAAPAAPAPWDDKQAKAALDEWQKLSKGNASMADKNRGLDRLAEGSHKLLVAPLAKVVEADKSVVLKKRAAALITYQPAADANAAIRRLLKNAKVVDQPGVVAELVRGLPRCGYDKTQWGELADLFERDFAAERVPLQEAILDLVIATKEVQAIPLLLRHVDEPIPENVEAQDNPPQEYWEARWKAWAVWRAKVKDALFAVTGQRFSTAAEAKEWLKKNPKK
jgi:hypothetical protein